MLQAAFLDCQFLDFLPFSDDGFVTPKVDVGGCDVVNALVIALMIVVIDEGFDLGFEIAGQEVILKQDAVFERLVPALNTRSSRAQALPWVCGWNGAPRT